MDNTEKLFRKISKKERIILKELIIKISDKKERKNLKAIKLKESDFYKLRKGRYRILFHLDKNKEVIIDSIRLRNEKTYKNL